MKRTLDCSNSPINCVCLCARKKMTCLSRFGLIYMIPIFLQCLNHGQTSGKILMQQNNLYLF